MNILPVVPARGGSKRIPGKNIRPLAGKPLIAWTIEAARAVAGLGQPLVTTDSEAIARAARDAGALVPWLRPHRLATDAASSVDVCLHALDWYEQAHGPVDGLLLLPPTSPFRTARTIERGLELFAGHPLTCVIAVAPARSHPQWCFTIVGSRLQPYLPDHGLHRRSQDLPPAYVVSGALYVIAPSLLRERRTFFIDEMVPIVLDQDQGVDLDTERDWQIAEAIATGRAVG